MCGVFGIISNEPVADALYHGLIQLQHRGQDAAGIFAYHPETRSQALHRDKGLVTQVFSPDRMPLPEAPWGLAHVRYPTAGSDSIEDTQPHYCIVNEKTVAMVHNGNVVNYVALRKAFDDADDPLQTTTDVEAILKMFCRRMPEGECTFEDVCAAVREVYTHVKGGYSVVGMVAGAGLFAFRDPQGIKPLLHGLRPDTKTHGFASETEALSFSGMVDIHSVEPGEVVWIDKHRRAHRRRIARERHAHCSFEWAYFSRMNAVLEDQEVYHVRRQLGLALARHIEKAKVRADVVVSVPDSARPAAIAVSQALRIPYEEGLLRKEHVGRTFLMPTQAVREKALSRKLAAVESVFKGKRVILVDDSVVRGTVSKKVVRLARLAGARKVFFASSFPPIRHSCHYGIDFPDSKTLVAHQRSESDIAGRIDADGLFYNDVEDLQGAIGHHDLCIACVNGEYPVGGEAFEQLRELRNEQLEREGSVCR